MVRIDHHEYLTDEEKRTVYVGGVFPNLDCHCQSPTGQTTPGAAMSGTAPVLTGTAAAVSGTAAYLERCRRKRNELSYDMAGVVTDTEATEILAEATEYEPTDESDDLDEAA